MFYGSASAAMDGVVPSVEITASAKMNKRLGSAIDGGVIEPYLKMTRALKQTLDISAGGELLIALPKKILTGACSVSIGSVPSAFDIAQAVWLANSTQYNITNTMGEKLNSAGSAGNPWASDTITNNDPGTFGELVQKDIKQKLIPMPGLILGA